MNNRQISDIAILAGRGLLPKIVYQECINKNIKCRIIGLKGEVDESLFPGMEYDLFTPHNVSLIFKLLKEMNISNIVIAGKVSRKHLPKLILDKTGLLIFKEIIKSGFNDTSIYSVIIKFIEKEGFKIISPDSIAEDLLAKKGKINAIRITEKVKKDIDEGVKILRGIIKYDIGQALVIDNGLVLGVEAVEGTNNLIERCAKFRKSLKGGVLIKLCKPHQDRRLDLPCIGPDTIKIIVKYGYNGITIEAKKSIIIAGAQTIKLANDGGVFIYGV